MATTTKSVDASLWWDPFSTLLTELENASVTDGIPQSLAKKLNYNRAWFLDTVARFKSPNQKSREALDSAQFTVGSHTLTVQPELKASALELSSVLVFYYLGELNDSLSYALGGSPLFDVSEDTDYVHTLLAKAIDEYASLRNKAAESKDAGDIDPRLEAIVERMLDKCILDGRYQQAIGMAIECRRLDNLEER